MEHYKKVFNEELGDHITSLPSRHLESEIKNAINLLKNVLKGNVKRDWQSVDIGLTTVGNIINSLIR